MPPIVSPQTWQGARWPCAWACRSTSPRR